MYAVEELWPPADYFFALHPHVERYLQEHPHKKTDRNLATMNGLLNAEQFIKGLEGKIASTLYAGLLGSARFNVEQYAKQVTPYPGPIDFD